VSWLAPTSNGGGAITKYTVTASPGGATQTTPNGTTLNATFTGLTNGTTYVFSVTATNAGGTGPASAPSNNTVPSGVPLAPTGVAATVNGVKSLSVTWTAPSGNGSAITSYTVTPSAGTPATVSAPPVSFTNLTVGTQYTFTVKATNANGAGAASAPSSAVTAADVPGQPTNIVATYQSDGTVNIAWTTPSSNGSPIIDYQIGSQVGPTYTTSSNPFNRPATNLVNGTKYTFYVTPRNAAGSGPLGSSNEITYGAQVPPATPTGWIISGDHFAICYGFDPSVGATSYNIYYSTLSSKVMSDQKVSVTSVGGHFSVSGNTTYFVAVTAVNAAGESAASPVRSATSDTGIGQPQCNVF